MLGHAPLSTLPLGVPGQAQDAIVVVGLASEADSAQSPSAVRSYDIGQSVELNEALDPSPTRKYPIGLPAELDTILAFGGLAVGLVIESNISFSPTPRKLKYPRDDFGMSVDAESPGNATAKAKVLGSGTSSTSLPSSIEVGIN